MVNLYNQMQLLIVVYQYCEHPEQRRLKIYGGGQGIEMWSQECIVLYHDDDESLLLIRSNCAIKQRLYINEINLIKCFPHLSSVLLLF